MIYKFGDLVITRDGDLAVVVSYIPGDKYGSARVRIVRQKEPMTVFTVIEEWIRCRQEIKT